MSAREIALIMFASLLVTAIAACVGASLSAWLAGSLTAGFQPEGHCSRLGYARRSTRKNAGSCSISPRSGEKKSAQACSLRADELIDKGASIIGE